MNHMLRLFTVLCTAITLLGSMSLTADNAYAVATEEGQGNCEYFEVDAQCVTGGYDSCAAYAYQTCGVEYGGFPTCSFCGSSGLCGGHPWILSCCNWPCSS